MITVGILRCDVCGAPMYPNPAREIADMKNKKRIEEVRSKLMRYVPASSS